MKLRNLQIQDDMLQGEEKEKIINSINRLDVIIENNYANLNTERAIEFNIGGRIGRTQNFIIIYNNPGKDNNPYVFLRDCQENKLHIQTQLSTFEHLKEYEHIQMLAKSIAKDFERLPKFLFLGEKDIERARELANIIDNYCLQERIHQAEKRHEIQNNAHQETENNEPEIDDDWDLER